MFKGAKKEDLRRIASELELCVSDKLTVLDFMDLIKNCDRYKNDPDSVHELANLIIEERKYDENPNFTSERVIQPSSLGVQKERETEESSMSQLSAKASVFKPINYIGEISKEVSSSQGVGDLFTATSYNTVFGYIASGSIPVSGENKPHCGLIKDNVDLEKSMRRFWEIENVEPETIKNKETIIYQRKLQRILWKENMDEPIKTFELSTVTNGTTSASFLATRTLKQLALDEAENFPLGSSVVMSDMYIDDVVNDININRCIVVEQPEVIELHGFSDASQSAYGAVVYCKSVTSDRRVLVHLIASKSRVAPTKQTTIPRLELCAAVLLAQLVHRVKQALKLNVTNTFLRSDSMIVLSWIRKESYQLKPFVANRIATIQEMTSSEQWRYVATQRTILPTSFPEEWIL
ncbi:integrase catalytic domain-containing protein [Trichonephila clavipes]|nr:integrase catalytic domain-containing protein [Trichonephila clavipes]